MNETKVICRVFIVVIDLMLNVRWINKQIQQVQLAIAVTFNQPYLVNTSQNKSSFPLRDTSLLQCCANRDSADDLIGPLSKQEDSRLSPSQVLSSQTQGL